LPEPTRSRHPDPRTAPLELRIFECPQNIPHARPCLIPALHQAAPVPQPGRLDLLRGHLRQLAPDQIVGP